MSAKMKPIRECHPVNVYIYEHATRAEKASLRVPCRVVDACPEWPGEGVWTAERMYTAVDVLRRCRCGEKIDCVWSVRSASETLWWNLGYRAAKKVSEDE